MTDIDYHDCDWLSEKSLSTFALTPLYRLFVIRKIPYRILYANFVEQILCINSIRYLLMTFSHIEKMQSVQHHVLLGVISNY